LTRVAIVASYTLAALTADCLVVLAELLWLRTGLFRRPAYPLTMGIVMGFQVPVDGWLTKTNAPIVIYNAHDLSHLRFPWDIPVEDFLFCFALVTSVLLVWAGRREGGAQ
jgi:lycopene cyclase domain-containing protein